MCHFYANPLSVLISEIDPEMLSALLSPVHVNALRALPSMKLYVEGKLEGKEGKEIQRILFDDFYLLGMIPQFMDDIEKHAGTVRDVVVILNQLSLRSARKSQWGELYIGVLLGECNAETPFVRELLQLQR